MIKDFTKLKALETFPWEETYLALAEAQKTVTTFNVGEIYNHGLSALADKRWSPSRKRWYLAIKHGFPIEGFNVNLVDPVNDITTAIFHCWDSRYWKPNDNYKIFTKLIQWINESKIFESTGRISFFVTLQGQFSPAHTDFTYAGIEAKNKVACTDFLWITDPKNPKILLSEKVQVPWACWFNPFEVHESLPSPTTQWSLRIDGKYNDGLSLLLS